MNALPSHGINRARLLAVRYLDVKEAVIVAGYAPEIDWQEDLDANRMTEADFLRELAWVVLSAGMRESVVRVKFDVLTSVFGGFRCASGIAGTATKLRRRALRIFNHPGKIDAILNAARLVVADGFPNVRRRVLAEGIPFLQSFPFIGPVTSFHLAKNLGLDVVKPDRHLVRIAKCAGYRTPEQMCVDISRQVSERVSVVDVVLWRYATLNRDYRAAFTIEA